MGLSDLRCVKRLNKLSLTTAETRDFKDVQRLQTYNRVVVEQGLTSHH